MGVQIETIVEGLMSIGLRLGDIQRNIQFQLISSLSESKRNSEYIPDEEKIRIAPMITYTEILDIIFCNTQERKEYFNGKTVADIGGGFSGLPIVIGKDANQINIIDPLFNENFSKYLTRDHYRIRKFLDEANARATQINNNKVIEKYGNVLNTLEYWIRGKIGSNVRLIPSVGEHIDQIQNNSQDTIFIKHVLGKDNTNDIKILFEAQKILKPGGTIFIVIDNEGNEINDLDGLLGNNIIHTNNGYTIFKLTKKE